MQDRKRTLLGLNSAKTQRILSALNGSGGSSDQEPCLWWLIVSYLLLVICYLFSAPPLVAGYLLSVICNQQEAASLIQQETGE
jgi:hypothetical protein